MRSWNFWNWIAVRYDTTKRAMAEWKVKILKLYLSRRVFCRMKRLTKKKLSPSMIFYAAARSSSNADCQETRFRFDEMDSGGGNTKLVAQYGFGHRKHSTRQRIAKFVRYGRYSVPRSVAKKVLKAQILIWKSIQGNDYDKIPGHLKYSRLSI